MTWVQESTVQSQEKFISFYRGHSDEKYQLMPSAYRIKDSKSYRAVEYQLYQDMLHRNPNAFAEDKTIFARLVRMQHHGLPTRLLDITQSPLVALFFACQETYDEKDDEKDGEVISFYRKQSEIIYPSAIPEITLVWLEISANYLLEMTRKITQEFNCLFEEAEIITNPHDPTNKDFLDFLSQRNIQIKTIKSLFNLSNFDLSNIFALIQNMEKETSSLFPWSGNPYPKNKDKSKFEKKFDKVIKSIITNQCEQMNISYNRDWYSLHSFLQEFTKFYFVYPPLNNERIRRQQGSFIIFPSVQPTDSVVDYFGKVTIKGNVKKNILNELENLGITQSYLFPELHEQAKDIILRYPPMVGFGGG